MPCTYIPEYRNTSRAWEWSYKGRAVFVAQLSQTKLLVRALVLYSYMYNIVRGRQMLCASGSVDMSPLVQQDNYSHNTATLYTITPKEQALVLLFSCLHCRCLHLPHATTQPYCTLSSTWLYSFAQDKGAYKCSSLAKSVLPGYKHGSGRQHVLYALRLQLEPLKQTRA